MTLFLLHIVRKTSFVHMAIFSIFPFITRSTCPSSFTIMGGFERGVLGAHFCHLFSFRFGLVFVLLASMISPFLFLPPRRVSSPSASLLHFRSLALSLARLADGLPGHLGLCGVLPVVG